MFAGFALQFIHQIHGSLIVHAHEYAVMWPFSSAGRGEVEDTDWRFFLTGGVALENPHPNPAPTWLGEKNWSEIVRASELPALEGLMKSVRSDPNRWKMVYDSPVPHEATFPAPFQKTSDMNRLILVRCLRSDKVIPAVQVRWKLRSPLARRTKF
ncbi:unnamed protein product [Hydatigera taeniaeformis]|uniref:Oxidored_molyb domain-containing protein n=1 Tax=Hydatigena taeniaeformis TaxID=6205 RepID=A0A0R3WXB7_HYDTA|nr:unnamed protein product [Hydatigera taeniaeformis]